MWLVMPLVLITEEAELSYEPQGVEPPIGAPKVFGHFPGVVAQPLRQPPQCTQLLGRIGRAANKAHILISSALSRRIERLEVPVGTVLESR